MKVTFIKHSSFLIETDSKIFLFDYYDGDLGVLPQNKDMYVFISHFHGDHYSEKIFDIEHENIKYIIDKGVKKKIKSDKLINFVTANSEYKIDDIGIKTLKSTDEGVAFVIDFDGLMLYHAGDLNYWHWEGEGDDYNDEMGKNYINEMKKLSKINFDIAFIPVDPRLEGAATKGLDEFLKYSSAKNIIPMHLWEDFSCFSKLINYDNIIEYKKENEELKGVKL